VNTRRVIAKSKVAPDSRASENQPPNDTDREKSMRSYVVSEGGHAGGNCLVRERRGGFSRSILPGFTEIEIFSSHVPIQTGIAEICGDKAFTGKMLCDSRK
jgi:hypothetical protein